MTSGEVVNPSFKVDEFLPKTIEDIPKDMLNNLPEDIKKVFFFAFGYKYPVFFWMIWSFARDMAFMGFNGVPF